MDQAKRVILQQVQQATFAKELSALNIGKSIAKQSPLQKLRPVLDNGIISVGGQLKHSELENSVFWENYWGVFSHVSLLLTHHYHEQVVGAIRAGGLDSGWKETR